MINAQQKFGQSDEGTIRPKYIYLLPLKIQVSISILIGQLMTKNLIINQFNLNV